MTTEFDLRKASKAREQQRFGDDRAVSLLTDELLMRLDPEFVLPEQQEYELRVWLFDKLRNEWPSSVWRKLAEPPAEASDRLRHFLAKAMPSW